MQEEFNRHLLGISFKLNSERIILFEDDDIKNHDKGINNIERKMNLKYRIPYLTKEIPELMDKIYAHTVTNHIIILNYKGSNSFNIYIPENIDENDKEFIEYCLSELSDSEVHLIRQKGEYLCGEKKDDFLHIKRKKLTFSLPNTKKTKK